MANHVRALGLESGGGRLAAVVAVDEASGSAVTIRARAFVNAAGVWASEVAGVREAPSLRPSKGVHLVFPASLLPLRGGCAVRAADGREIVAVRHGSVVVVGTTDTEFEGELREPAVEPADVEYLLGAITETFDVDLHPEDAHGGWAGLRPLVAGRAGCTADLSRRHHLGISSSGLVTITGGKLTTFRCMALDAVNAVCRQLGECRRARPQEIPLGCAEPLERVSRRAADTAERLGLHAEVASRLVSVHGDRAPALLELIREDPTLADPLVPGLEPLAVEAVWAVRGEMAVTLADVLDRRLRLTLYDRSAGLGSAGVGFVAAEAGWSADRLASERTTYREATSRERGPLADIEGADPAARPCTIGSVS